ncbi:hypothetical protein L248_1634 [Schleiferilactobacillus shenzhenensis LY-73]|uniref:Alpha/beta hydrolase fold-5 domain-containing protein n=1 Tax=Schleiferilactobacillus shenzhenensis LY-73 TaxID=1231336 RepID=U4TH29_9LACO|nr:hypothetical protein L248_1634 [Schleiferilactobacillus shenzhenensis LY-73]
MANSVKRRYKVLIGIGIAFVLGIIGVYIAVRASIHPPTAAAERASQSARVTDDYYYYPSRQTDTPMVVFYPGALVEPASYSLWAKKVAAAGYPVYVLKVPLDMALLAQNKGDSVVGRNQRAYVVGGHSLGGVIAARYAQKHLASSRLRGAFFLAGYPDKKGDLRHADLPVLSVSATWDVVLNMTAYKKAKQYLPATADYRVITGGNHAGFGSYTGQAGDKKAAISNAQQQQEITDLLVGWLKKLPQK